MSDVSQYFDPMDAKAHVTASKIRYIEAQTHGQLIDNRTAEALAITAEISAAREIDSRKWEDVGASRVREYHFTSQVDGDSVDRAIDVLSRWQRLDADDPTRPYKFVICSPGGAVVYGMKLYSTLKAIASKRPVITVASGLCASMATIIHQAGTLRVIEPGCSYLIHDVSGESFGSVGSMQDTMDWMNKLNHALHVMLAEKASISLDEIAALGKRRDGWFMPEEIVAYGLADVIGFALDAHVGMPVPEVVKAVEWTTPPKRTRARKAVEVKK